MQLKIFIPTHSDILDGVYSYIETLSNALNNTGHIVDIGVPSGKYDIVFTKELDFVGDYGKYILHIHNAIIPTIYKDLMPRFLHQTNALITCNSAYQREQLKQYAPEDRIFVLPNCVNENIFKPTYEEKIKKSILYLGRISYNNKNTIIPLVEAAKKSGYNLTMAGEVDDDMEEIISGVNVLGGIRRQSDLVSTINRYEYGVGVGRAAREMILCGLPVMVFGLGYAGWVTKDNHIDLNLGANMTSRTFPELSVKEKVKRIVEDLRNPSHLDRNTAVKSFGMYANAEKFVKTFQWRMHENL